MNRALAAAACLPIPFWGYAAVLAAPGDRLVRYHGLQSGTWVLLALAALTLLGGLRIALGGPVKPLTDALAAGVLLGALAGGLWALWHASHGRFVRLRPAWDLLAAPRRPPSGRTRSTQS